MKTVGVVANCRKRRTAEVLKRLSDKAASLGITVLVGKDEFHLAKVGAETPLDEITQRAEAVIAVGGDGTMLRTVRQFGAAQKPVMGVNVGGLGFLTTVSEAGMDSALERLTRNDFTVVSRAMADCRVTRNSKAQDSHCALNDVVLSSGASTRILHLEVFLNDEIVTSYMCDGLIVSTPTGSTGHSMSAGGPIVCPAVKAFVVTPICPHALSVRPLVAADDSVIRVSIYGCSGQVLLSVDGQVGQALAEGDSIEVRRSEIVAQFIHLPGDSYFSVLRQKLHWRGSSL